MSPDSIAIGDLVIKQRGDYSYFGFVVAKFRKRKRPGAAEPPWRFVVENLDGMLAIFSAEQLDPHYVETPGHFAAGLD